MRKVVLAALAATMLAGSAPAALVFTLTAGQTVVVDYGQINGNYSIQGTATALTSDGDFDLYAYLVPNTSLFSSVSRFGPSMTIPFGFGQGGPGLVGDLRIDFTTTNMSVVTVNYDGPGVIAVAPEPAAWAMMLVGFGAVGWAMRRRQAAVRFA